MQINPERLSDRYRRALRQVPQRPASTPRRNPRTPTEREAARRMARVVYRAKYPSEDRPKHCPKCGKSKGRFHRHHIWRTVSQLIDDGDHLDPDAHVCVWLCHDCHKSEHPEVAILQAA